MKNHVIAALAAASMLVLPSGAKASTLIADVVIDYFNSGDFASFPDPDDVFGGTWPGTAGIDFPITVPITHATDGDFGTFISLAKGSYIVLGFSGGFVIDGPGNDLFIAEVGAAAETADIYVSSDWGATFTFLGKAFGDQVTEFDLGSIGYTDKVNAVKVRGLDSFGGSPGFDLAYVQGLEGSVIIAPIPLPGALPLMLGALGLVGAVGVRRRRRH